MSITGEASGCFADRLRVFARVFVEFGVSPRA